ncbi:MAG: polymerase delta prime subunit, partial [Bryobacterales bacterium]|nr:polymerase delta prime subunit [Bryobacterales bacterium]
MFERFWGNPHAVRALERMISHERIPQTLLFSGPEGVGKATLARRFAALLLDHAERIEKDDLSLPENTALVQGREKWPAEKRNEDPLLFASHPDFVTFAPDGPLRQLTIPQLRLLRERAPFKPSHGTRRIFLIDHVDRAGDNATNSLLKILEEPPEHLILILTAENPYDLLTTIRSRSVLLSLSPLSNEDMRAFAAARSLDQVDRRIALSAGCPGTAVSLDLAVHEKRRGAMHVLLKVAANASPFAAWLPHSEAISRSKNEKLELYLRLLYDLLRDVMILREGAGEIRNADLRSDLQSLAVRVTRPWIVRAV